MLEFRSNKNVERKANEIDEEHSNQFTENVKYQRETVKSGS